MQFQEIKNLRVVHWSTYYKLDQQKRYESHLTFRRLFGDCIKASKIHQNIFRTSLATLQWRRIWWAYSGSCWHMKHVLHNGKPLLQRLSCLKQASSIAVQLKHAMVFLISFHVHFYSVPKKSSCMRLLIQRFELSGVYVV